MVEFNVIIAVDADPVVVKDVEWWNIDESGYLILEDNDENVLAAFKEWIYFTKNKAVDTYN